MCVCVCVLCEAQGLREMTVGQYCLCQYSFSLTFSRFLLRAVSLSRAFLPPPPLLYVSVMCTCAPSVGLRVLVRACASKNRRVRPSDLDAQTLTPRGTQNQRPRLRAPETRPVMVKGDVPWQPPKALVQSDLFTAAMLL
jgi:hypothetical protein